MSGPRRSLEIGPFLWALIFVAALVALVNGILAIVLRDWRTAIDEISFAALAAAVVWEHQP